MVSIEEYPLIFMNTPASLQVLASAKIALTVWRREFANTNLWDERSYSQKKPRCKEVLDVPVPRRIQAQIDKKIVIFGKELRKWILFHLFRKFFDGDSTEEFLNCSKHIVVDFSASIDYKATAINIVNSGELNDAVNYKISCTFCLEDKVKRFWPAVANDPPIDTNSPYDKCNLSYWNALMKVGNSIADTDDELFKLRMMEAKANTKTVPFRRGDETAFRYFCEMLPDDVRISKIILWLKSHNYRPAVTVTRTLLSTLGRVHAGEVFVQAASEIFRILMMNDDYFQFAHQLWTLMGHLVVEDESNFTYVVFELWKMAFDPDGDEFNFTRCDQTNDLLLEIWSNASDELKAHVSDTFLRDELIFFSGYSDPYRYHDDNTIFSRINFASYYGHDMTFTLEMMSKLSDDVDKEQLWQNTWRRLVLRSKPLYLEKFMRMCLKNDDDIELYKNELADFDDLFESLIKEGFYVDLNDYLLFCSKDAVQFQQLGKKVLGANLHLISLHDDDRFAKFEWFVSEVFVSIEEFKTQMISSAECVKNLLTASKAYKISSKDFSRIIRRFVNNEEELQQVKRKLFEHCCTYPVDYEWSSNPKFNADQWQEFLVWCTADIEEISTFKRSLNVNVIFLERLKIYLYGEYCVEVLNFLGGFLNWYFGNEEDAKNFKLEKVKNYKQIDILRVEMEKKFIYQFDKMYKLLMWLFDGNLKTVIEFCESCNCPLRERP